MENMEKSNGMDYARRYLWVEIPTDNHIVCDGLRKMLIDNNIKFETSGHGDLTHFESYVNDTECEMLDNELDRLWDIWNRS